MFVLTGIMSILDDSVAHDFSPFCIGTVWRSDRDGPLTCRLFCPSRSALAKPIFRANAEFIYSKLAQSSLSAICFVKCKKSQMRNTRDKSIKTTYL